MKTDWTIDSLKAFESDLAERFKRGEINCPLHLSGGNESQLIEIFKQVKEADYVISTHRSHYHYLLKGGAPERLIQEVLGSPSGCSGGRGRSMHIYDREIRFFTSAIVAGGCAIGAGIGLSIKKRSLTSHVWCFVGDGAEDSGHFFEAVRFSAARRLPVTFIIEDNDLSVKTSKKDRWHNWRPIVASNVIRYNYERTWPHVGVGQFVQF